MKFVPGWVMIATTAFALQGAATPDVEARLAAAKAIPLLQHTSRVFSKTQDCFSCHHQGLLMLVLASARERGLPVEENLARDTAVKTFTSVMGNYSSIDRVVQAPYLIDPALSDGYALMAASAAGVEPSLTTGIVAARLASWQWPDGRWSTQDLRPPLSHSQFSATAIAARAVRLYLPELLSDERDARLVRARRWLQENQPRTTEDHAMRLLGLLWCAASPQARAEAAAALLAQQQADGGWAQIQGRPSDAYATGETLYALRVAGGVPASDHRWRRGIRWLLDHQHPDGSWLVETRLVSPASVSPPFFDSEFPNGKHQFISTAGTAWATLALLEALPAVPRPARPLPVPEVGPKSVSRWMTTAAFGTASELRSLLDAGLDVNLRTQDGTTLLMIAARDPQKVKLLIQRGAEVKAKAKTGFTALMIVAGYGGNSRSVKVLLAAGAEAAPGQGVMFNMSPLALAAMAGDRESVSLLHTAGADVKRKVLLLGTFPSSAAFLALLFGHHDIARDLLSWGSPVDERDADNMTLLDYAVMSNQPEAVQVLLQAGADPNAVDRHGFTPLLYAATVNHGDTEVLQLLLKHGADPRVKSKGGSTAFAQASRFGHEELRNVLESAATR